MTYRAIFFALMVALIFLPQGQPAAASKSKWKKESRKFCESVLERRDFAPLSAKEAEKQCRGFIDDDNRRARVAAYIYCSEAYDIRWLDFNGKLANPEKLEKLGCATNRADASKLNDLMKEAGFKDAPWANWPLRKEVLVEDQKRSVGMVRPKGAATMRAFGPRGASIVLPHLIDFDGSRLCDVRGEGETELGNSRDEIDAEMRRRGLLSEEEWAAVEARRPEVGMSSCVARAAFPPVSRGIISMQKPGDTAPRPHTSIYKCRDGESPQLPFCPETSVTFLNGRIIKLERYEKN